ncbi:MAG: FAD-binding oxidoreductase [Pseudomonadota bacterium]
MPQADRPATFFHASDRPVQFEILGDQSLAVPVCVIGGGVAGLSLVRAFVEANMPVALVEAQAIGAGASGRASGIVSAGFDMPVRRMEAVVGSDHARELYRLSRDGVAHVQDDIRDLGRADIADGHGALTLYRHNDMEAMRSDAEEMARFVGDQPQVWAREKVYSYVRSLRYFGALFDPEPIMVQPVKYCRALARDAVRKGGVVLEHSPVQSITPADLKWRVSTSRGEVLAEQVVLAGGAYQQNIWPRVERALLPMTMGMVASKPLGPRHRDAVRFNGALSDQRHYGNRFRIATSVEGGRLIWSGRAAAGRLAERQLRRSVIAELFETFPQLSDAGFEMGWAGQFNSTQSGMPLVGPIDDGMWVCAGFGSQGIANATVTGRLVASAILYGDDRWRLLEPFMTRWGGGPLGRLSRQAGLWRAAVRDYALERRSG